MLINITLHLEILVLLKAEACVSIKESPLVLRIEKYHVARILLL